MKANYSYKSIFRIGFLTVFALVLSLGVSAQRLPHKATGNKGGTHNVITNSGQGNRGTTSVKPNNQNSNRPGNSGPAATRPNNSNTRPGNPGNNSGVNKPGNNNQGAPGGTPSNNQPGNRPTSPVHHPGSGGHTPGPGNDHHHNNGPKPHPKPPTHPPYVWGGFHIYFYNPYFYFPYQPYYWNNWYPWGHLVTSIVETAIIVEAINDNGNKEEYNYDEGNFYLKTEDGFVAVAPPVGAVVPSIPQSAEVVVNGSETYFYYGATFYKKVSKGYEVVIPSAGTVVSHLPEGAEEIKIGEQTFVLFDNMYFQPVKVDGNKYYEIVEVQED